MEYRVFKCSVLVLFNAVTCCLQGQNLRGSQIAKKNTDTGKSSYVITSRDADIIKRSAINAVKEFESDLNTLSFLPGMDSLQVSEIIRNRYLDERRKIFYDSTATIEDDIRQATGDNDGSVQVKPVPRYLRDFDLMYRKNSSRTISFTNIQTSNVKKGDYLYIQVFYECLFAGRPKLLDNPYVTTKRVAELKVEKATDRWRAWIINVHFLRPNDMLDKNKNDVQLVKEPEPTQKSDKEADSLFAQVKIFVDLGLLKEAEEDLNKALIIEPQNVTYHYTLAEGYRQKKQYRKAIDLYREGLKIDSNPLTSTTPAIELANIYLELKQPDSAFNCFNKIFRQNRDANATYGMAVALVQKNEIGWALEFFEEAFKSGKMHRRTVEEDGRLDEIRENQAFKLLKRKYF